MKSLTSAWSVQHPNAGQNIQKASCLNFLKKIQKLTKAEDVIVIENASGF